MSLYIIGSNILLFEQESNGNYFYIVKEGELSLIINKNQVKTFKSGDSFGELALLHNAPRSGTVKTNTEVKVWAMERKSFRKIIDHINTINHQENKNYIASIQFLSKKC